MTWKWIAAALVLLPAHPSAAVTRSWETEGGLPNEVTYTLQITCPNPGFVCGLIDGYSEQDVSVVSGSGTLDLDDVADTFQIDTDSSQDVGGGAQPAYLTMTGTDLAFPIIPLAGIPEITNVLTFALSKPAIAATGLDLSTPGDYPFSQIVNYSGTGLVIGDLEFDLGPNLIVPPADITLSGVLRVLGDVDSNGSVDFQIRSVTGSFALQNLTTIAGEPVTVDVTADLNLHLKSDFSVLIVPSLGPPAIALLVATLLATGIVARRRLRI